MACENCHAQQKENEVAYYRWGNANIGIQGCDEHLQEVFKALTAAQQLLAEDNLKQCQKCKRTLPNNLINALMTGGEGERKVQDLCALCGLALRNIYLGVPDAQFTGELAQQFYERTVEYYKKTNQVELPADHNCQADEVDIMHALAKTYAKTKPKS